MRAQIRRMKAIFAENGQKERINVIKQDGKLSDTSDRGRGEQ